jgi:UPF0716 protein FxsA
MFLLLIVWVLAELFVIVKVAEWLGFFWMLLLLVASWPVGWRIMRHEGRAALAQLSAAGTEGRAPTTEVIGGVLVLVGGLLFMIPGFLTDIVGALLLLRPTRKLAGRAVQRQKRFAGLSRLAGWATTFAGPSGPRRYDAEGTAFDVNDRQLRP